jgi:hypothetical protein
MCEIQRGWKEGLMGLGRVIQQDPYVVARVWKNAQDKKTWCAGVENHGGMGNYGCWPYEINRIKFQFKRRKDAVAWANQQIPEVRALLKKGLASKEKCG